MDSGNVYTIDGDDFYMGKKNISADLSVQQKNDIRDVLEDRLETEEERKVELQQLNDNIKNLKNQIKELEKNVDIIEEKQQKLNKARDAYISSKMNLIEKEREFDKLKTNNSISEKEKINFEEDIIKLKQNVNEAKRRLEAIR